MAALADAFAFLERVFDFLAGVFEAGLGLVGLSALLDVPIMSQLAQRLLGLPAEVVDLVAGPICAAQMLSLSIAVRRFGPERVRSTT